MEPLHSESAEWTDMSLEAATEVGRKVRGLKEDAALALHASAGLEVSRCSSRALDLSWPATGLTSSVDWFLNSTADDDGDVSPEALPMPWPLQSKLVFVM